MPAPTLQELLVKYGSLANIPENALRAAGYERVAQDAESANATSVHVQLIGAPGPKPPPAPKVVKDGRRIIDRNWGYRPGWPGRG